MAKRRNRNKRKQLGAEREQAMRTHIYRLGLTSLVEYHHWCDRQGFSVKTNKTTADLKRELRSRRVQDETNDFARSRITRNTMTTLSHVCGGQLRVEDLPATTLRRVCTRVAATPDNPDTRQSLLQFLSFVDERTDLILENGTWGNEAHLYIGGLIEIHNYRNSWLRPLHGWKPRTRNRHRQFSSLLRHLLSTYPVPLFFDSVWFASDEHAAYFRRWFLHVGQGKNLRTANSPVQLTKKTVHYLMQAPDDCTVEQAVRWGQVLALGGDQNLCRTVIGTRLGRSLQHDEFWCSVLRFFIANPLLDRALVAPLIDFIHHQKFESEAVVVDGGAHRVIPPPQPNLSMHGRTAVALIRQMEAWHRQLGHSPSDPSMRWEASGILPFKATTKKGDKCVTWRIEELLSKSELAREGRVMMHCVASYAQSCRRGQSSIWSMTREGSEGRIRPVQTIEVTRNRAIVQARGRRNQLPNASQARVIHRWAGAAGLTIGCSGFGLD